MGLLAWFTGKNKIKYELELLPPFYEVSEPIMDFLEKKGYDLKFKRNKRNLGIIGFASVEELNIFLSDFNIIATSPNEGPRAAFGSNCGRFVFHINLLSKGKKNYLDKNLKKAFLSLYKKGNLDIFYSP